MSRSAALRSRVGCLPAEVDSFVGRRRELDEVRRLFSHSPMVTIVGPGGVGKTRLALRAAAGLARSFRDGVWLAELAKLQDPALVTQAVADAFGVVDEWTTLTDRSLVHSVSDRHLLLVLDNCEHLLEETARLADALLRGAPELRILATSREPLGIAGETIMPLTPLVVPHPSKSKSAETLPSYEAVQLFLDRAVAASPDFELTDDNGVYVAQICRQLDGIPLAIELAAVRIRALAPKELADRLSDRFQVLTGGSRVGPLRHRTLRRCIDWSYEQCSPAEQLLWNRLAVFAGTFDLEAVESICAFDGLEHKQILELVATLVDKSVVSLEARHAGTHYKLLESLREYGMEKLVESGEASPMRRRHADWYHRFVARFEAGFMTARQAELADGLDAELPNVRETLDFSLGEGQDPVAAVRTINAMYFYWLSRGLVSEARYWLRRGLAGELSQASRDRVVGLHYSVGLAGLQGDLDGAREAAEAARVQIRQLEAPAVEAFGATIEAILAMFEGDPQRALAQLPKAIEGHRLSGDLHRELEMLVAYEFALALTGDGPGSAAAHERVLELTRPRGESWFQAYSLWAAGLAAWRREDNERAGRLLEESLRLRRLMQDSMGSVWSLVGLTLVLGATGESEKAAVLLGATRSLTTAAGIPASVFPGLAEAVTDCASTLIRNLGDAAFDKAIDQGRQLDVLEAVTFALDDASPRQKTSQPAPSVLTKREWEVASLVGRGLTNKEIAAKLVISQRTAEGHVENILTKLSYTSRTQIAVWVADQQQDGTARPS
ncbi:LuxR C-terminal-related transcriptional regulator [Nocardia sp. CA-120079]|uniref:LuxR C-terminal-related transcriptional regulator n=1 Tax=Nocardia sp. CA-120079 TaxID=3239974 RepID=UPI003D968DE2